MIQANELRIGNIVQDGNGSIMRVVSIHDDGTIYCDFDGNEGDVWEFDDKTPCYGIELTEETLLEWGFILLDKNYKGQDFNVYKLWNFTYNTSYNKFWINSTYSFKQPKYLHQLQNLFFNLKGEELTKK